MNVTPVSQYRVNQSSTFISYELREPVEFSVQFQVRLCKHNCTQFELTSDVAMLR